MAPELFRSGSEFFQRYEIPIGALNKIAMFGFAVVSHFDLDAPERGRKINRRCLMNAVQVRGQSLCMSGKEGGVGVMAPAAMEIKCPGHHVSPRRLSVF